MKNISIMKEKRGPSIFISHAWYNDELYTDIKYMLDEIFETGWKNLSIPRDQGLDLMSTGKRALYEEIELQLRMIENVCKERAELNGELEYLKNKAKSKQKQLESETKAEKERIEEQRGHAEAIIAEETYNLEGLKNDLKEINHKLRLEGRIENCTVRINELIEISAGDRQVKAEKDYLKILMTELKS